MTAENFLDTLGGIDDKILADAFFAKKKRRLLRSVTAAAAAVVLMLGTLPAATALGNDAAYSLLYRAMPYAAQSFKPVRAMCEDNSIELKVISADIDGDEARIYFGVTDKNGRIDESADLYDSYYINAPFATSSTCNMISFDSETSTAYFVADITSMEGKSFDDKKLTFGFGELIYNKAKGDTFVDIDLSLTDTSPEVTRGRSRISGVWFSGSEPDTDNMYFLENDGSVLYDITQYNAIMAMGYIDGELHILVRNDRSVMDNNCFLTLTDENGEEYAGIVDYGAGYTDSEEKYSYKECIFDIEYEKLAGLRLRAEYFYSTGHIEGNWQVTTRLK